ncbi:1351_t:CDS:2 [Funneliformis geosporum]|uniref:1351_t:CDS:1 n=1 Tax=Funneliformis geosporum TaxID=1117311 RepID=A0A9W4SUZ5_9GLOM|nr:1351_t:CDS:2 [Funneliformis geosporum]
MGWPMSIVQNTAKTPLLVIAIEEDENNATGLTEINEIRKSLNEHLNEQKELLILKRQYEGSQIILSSINTEKRRKLCLLYVLREQAIWMTSKLLAINLIHLNNEDSEGRSCQQSALKFWGRSWYNRCSGVPTALRVRDFITLLFELKKKVKENDENQAIGKLIAANAE